MEKNFNKAYAYIVAIFTVGLAMANVIAYFRGVGFALIGAGVLLFLAISNILKSDKKNRFGDIYALLVFEFIMFIVLFFAYDFNINGITNKFPMIMRNICAIYSIFAIAYVLFRYVSEVKGKEYKVVEYLLGNYTPAPKQKKEKKAKKVKLSKEEIKKNKELENGTLEPKPSTVIAEPVEEVKQESGEASAEQAEKIEEVKEETQTNQNFAQNNVNNPTNRTGYWY